MVEVYAASVNPIDNIVRAGYMKEMISITFPYTYDVSGVILEVGDNVYFLISQNQIGTIAEYTLVKEGDLALKTSNITHEETASITLVGLTVLQALVKGNLQKGQKVLIHAGSGGVGTLAEKYGVHFSDSVLKPVIDRIFFI